MALKQHQTFKLEQRLSPNQIQLIKLLEIPAMELDQRIKQELEDNPALDEGAEEDEDDVFDGDDEQDNEKEEDEFDLSDYMDDVPDYKTQINNRSKDEEEKVIPYTGEQSFHERLLSQIDIYDYTERQQIILATIIGNLDESGYLSRSVEALVDDLAFSSNFNTTEKEVEEVLYLLQEMEPIGIGARDLHECLLIQIRKRQDGNISRYTAKVILEDFYEEFTRKHYNKICELLEIEEDDLKDAIDEILKLNPKPGGSTRDTGRNYQQIIPDFTVFEIDGELEISLNGRNAPDLKVNRAYRNLLESYNEGAKVSKSDKEAFIFIRQKLENARWFIDALKQRQEMLMKTMEIIVKIQHDYFLTGDESTLKPMILKTVADQVDYDVSTISRVVNSKYVQTNFGIFALKHFFSEAVMSASGELISNRVVMQIIVDAIKEESKKKPLTDDQLTELLNENGISVTRRTVSKYREKFNIPVARMRKEL